VAAVLGYAALALLLVGVVWRVGCWLATPSSRRIVLTPAPRSAAGVAWRLFHETVVFTSLWRASPWTWLFGWCFHLGLLLVLLQHLRYVTAQWWPWVSWLAAHGHVATTLMLGGLMGLWLRRVLVDRVRWISRPSDHALLALLAAIALSGAWMKYLEPVNVLAVKAFVRGLLCLAPVPLPHHAVLLIHLSLVALLMALFPFGKLMHGPGVWLNPVRAQTDSARERVARR
jgi:nitrate reductase gamma subunit